MKYTILISITFLIVIFVLGGILARLRNENYELNTEVAFLQRQASITSSLGELNQKYTIEVGCELTIREHFGELSKWRIPVVDSDIDKNYIFFKSGNIKRSWFPKGGPPGGMGNSVLSTEPTYKLELSDKSQAEEIFKNLNSLVKYCGNKS